MFNIFKKRYLHLILVRKNDDDRMLLGCALAGIKGKDIILKKRTTYIGNIYQIVCTNEQYETLSMYCSFNEVEAK